MNVLTYKTTFMTKMSAYASKPFSLKGYKLKINLHRNCVIEIQEIGIEIV